MTGTSAADTPAREASGPRREFYLPLAGLLALGFMLRLAYVLAQPAVDPTFARPMLDGLLYIEWARDIVAGESYDGAFYLSPLYPFVLAGLLRTVGENYAVLYLFQHALAVSTAGMLAVVARRHAGGAAGLATAALALLHHPQIFFASVPSAEAVVLPLLALSLLVLTGQGRQRFAVAGLVVGFAAIGRPNLLLLPLAWAALSTARSRYRDAFLLLAGVALVVSPVMLRNYAASGHAVPISANAGMTAYHGNGPGAVGVYTPSRLFTGSPATQRAEATQVASNAAGRQLDPVEADRFWGRQAIRTRLEDPFGTLRLLVVRGVLLIDTHEHGLDYDPMLDRNPWRATWRLPRINELALVPLALLLGLSACSVFLGGLRASGGAWVWSSIVACAATPILFYVSSRYRLPMAALLTVPAGCGAAALLAHRTPQLRRRGLIALAVGALWSAASLLVPSGELKTEQRAQALTNRASAYKANGRLDEAERAAREALALGSRAALVRYNLAVILDARGRSGEAEALYRALLLEDPGMAEAAGNLASLLIRRGIPGEAVSLLRRALVKHPSHVGCWNNLVVALGAEGRLDEARAAAREAVSNGVSLNPELLREILGAGDPGQD